MPAEGGQAFPAEPVAAPAVAGLRHGSLNQVESLGQSIANIAPTLTPALNIAVVAGLAGTGSWLAYLIATIGLLFVAANISTLARRHPLSGSYFVYIGRTIGPFAGALGGWSMIEAYLLTAVAALIGLAIFVENMLTAFGFVALVPPRWATMLVFGALVWIAGYRDIKLSSRLGLLLESLSVVLVIAIFTLVLSRQDHLVDLAQLDISRLHLGGVTSSLAFAAFSFVGFESAATLARETRDPARLIPRAILGSCAAVGLFFTLTAYCMVLGMGDDAATIGNSASPLTDLTARAGIAWAAGIIYLSATVSSFACVLACITAASRLLFSMSRYRMLHGAADAVHRTHQTPHVAVGICCVITLSGCLVTLPMNAVDAFGFTATLATFGFLLVYLLISIAAPLDLRRAGVVRRSHVMVGAIGAVLMALVILGTLVPVPPAPYNLVPYLFAGYMLVGVGWFGALKLRRPLVLAMIEHDLEA